jgi:rod shape-determining protein MreD
MLAMDENVARRRWLGRLTFVLLGLFIIFTHLIPLETVPPSLGGTSLDPIVQPRATAGTETDVLFDPVRWIAPDLLILLALAWVTRRPSFAPALAIGVVFLLADMLLQRPPGLWAALVLILSEILRGRSRSMRTLPFWLEWATVAIGIVIITAIYRFTLSMVLVTQAPLGLTLVQLMLTIVVYPAVVFVSYALFGVSRPAPGEVDALGHRL